MTPEFETLVARVADLGDGVVMAHGVGPVVAARHFDRGHVRSPAIERSAWSAAFAEMSALLMLDRIAPHVVEPVLVLKGPEVAACYPTRGQRQFADVDLLAADADALHHRLVDAGFQQPGVDAAPRHHHLPALVSPGLDAVVEIHAAVGTYRWMRPPSASELVERSAPSRCHPAFRRPDDADHAVLLQAHAVSTRATLDLRDALDVAAVASDWDAVERAARAWDARRLAVMSRKLVVALASDGGSALLRRYADDVIRRPPGRRGPVARAVTIGLVAGPTRLARHLGESGRRLEEATRSGGAGGSALRRLVTDLRGRSVPVRPQPRDRERTDS